MARNINIQQKNILEKQNLHFFVIQTRWRRRCSACRGPKPGNNRLEPFRNFRTKTEWFQDARLLVWIRPESDYRTREIVPNLFRKRRIANGKMDRTKFQGSDKPEMSKVKQQFSYNGIQIRTYTRCPKHRLLGISRHFILITFKSQKT